MNPLSILAFARANWKLLAAGLAALVVAGLLTALLMTRATLADRTSERDQARQALAQQIADYRAAATAAQVKAQATDARNAQIQKETQDALETQLADARARAADYARRLSGAAAETDPGRSGGGMSQAASAAGGADRAGASAVLADDLAICSENTVKAAGWRDWWEKVSQGE